MKTPSWVNWFYQIFGSKLQGWHDFLDKLDYDPKTKEFIDKIWAGLEPQVQNAIVTLVMALVAKYGVDKGQAIFESIMSKITPMKFN